MSYEVYWGSGSPVSWRVLLGMAIKRVPYESHRLDLSNRQHRSPEYLRLSPRGAFPILRHGNRVVRDSMAILVYLDRLHPEPPLFGTDASSAATVWEAIGEHQDHLGTATETITRALFRKNGMDNPKPAADAVGKAYAELERLDGELATQPWVRGDQLSAADIVYYPTLHRLLRAARSKRAEEIGLSLESMPVRHPNLNDWKERLEELPGVADTYPPHWRADP